MIVGIPKEIKADENRVAITPAGVSALVSHGHTVLVQKSAGLGSGLLDKQYQESGAKLIEKVEDLWDQSQMIMKVKEPIDPELSYMRKGQILFTYLHLAASHHLTKVLLEKEVVGVAYETIQMPGGHLPLLTPMSEVAGRLSVQVGAFCLEAKNGGSGILLSGASGVRPAKVVIIGAGISGFNACKLAVGIGAQVSILDINPQRLSYVADVTQGHVMTVMSNHANIEEEVLGADLVIGAVLIPGAKAPKLISEDLVKKMKKGSAIVDIAVDQGGCCETTRPTTHTNPTYITHGIVHYCVTNMPGMVPRTSTYALTNVTLSYALELANKGYRQAMQEDFSLQKGLNLHEGKITCKAVAEAFDMPWEEFKS